MSESPSIIPDTAAPEPASTPVTRLASLSCNPRRPWTFFKVMAKSTVHAGSSSVAGVVGGWMASGIVSSEAASGVGGFRSFLRPKEFTRPMILPLLMLLVRLLQRFVGRGPDASWEPLCPLPRSGPPSEPGTTEPVRSLTPPVRWIPTPAALGSGGTWNLEPPEPLAGGRNRNLGTLYVRGRTCQKQNPPPLLARIVSGPGADVTQSNI